MGQLERSVRCQTAWGRTECLFIRACVDRILGTRTACDHMTIQLSQVKHSGNTWMSRSEILNCVFKLEMDKGSSEEVTNIYTVGKSLVSSQC